MIIIIAVLFCISGFSLANLRRCWVVRKILEELDPITDENCEIVKIKLEVIAKLNYFI